MNEVFWDVGNNYPKYFKNAVHSTPLEEIPKYS